MDETEENCELDNPCPQVNISLPWPVYNSKFEVKKIFTNPQGYSPPLRIFKNLQDKFDLDQILPSTISLQPPRKFF